MKFTIKLLLVVLLTLAIREVTYAQKIAVATEEFAPYNFLDRDKKLTGMSTEIVEEVLKRAQLDYRIDVYPWARAYKIVQEQPNALIYSIVRSEKREALFKWVGVIASMDVYLYRLKERNDIQVTKPDDIKKYKVGAVRENVDAQYLESLGIKLEITNSAKLNNAKLAMGRIDMTTSNEYAISALQKSDDIDPNSVVKAFKLDALSTGMYMAFSLNTADEVVDKCKLALAGLRKDGTLEKIRLKYFK